MAKMTPENKKIWTDALRSGTYKQGKQSLKIQASTYDENLDEDVPVPGAPCSYCCLGVLGTVLSIVGLREISDGEYLDDDFAEPLGLDHDTQRALAKMNDGSIEGLQGARVSAPGKTFPEIADWIDANL